MAFPGFLVLSALWFLGLVFLELACIRREGEDHPRGELGAFADVTWLSWDGLRRPGRRLLFGWLVGGGAVLALVTAALQRLG